MADVYAVFGTLLALGIVLPGMLLAWRLLVPGLVKRAQVRIDRSPWKSFGVGLIGSLVVALPAVILSALPFGAAKFMGAGLILGSLWLASLGAAGIAAAMAERIRDWNQSESQGVRHFLLGAAALELAAAFPFIGWFLFIPLTVITSFGATIFALLHWVPSGQPDAAHQPGTLEGQIQHEPQSA